MQKNKKETQKEEIKDCETCMYCECVWNGAYACLDESFAAPAYVIIDYNLKTDDYLRCREESSAEQKKG